jgi:hypothetical protein
LQNGTIARMGDRDEILNLLMAAPRANGPPEAQA